MHMSALERAYAALKPEQDYLPPLPEVPPRGAAQRVQTAVPLPRLAALNRDLMQVPEGFSVHRKLERARERRRVMLDHADDRAVDWSAAEDLAFASILEEGIAIRLTGEDVERGTFSQRHGVLHDSVTGAEYMPLAALPQARAAFEVHNSPLSENAAVGFEFGYNIQEPRRLVVWEAQYGDFINGAQVVLDEFVTSGRDKVGAVAVPRVAPAAWLRGSGAGSLERTRRAVPAGGCRHQHASGELHHGRAVLPFAASPGAAARNRSPAARGADAQKPVASCG